MNSEMIKTLEDQLRDMYGRLAYTHKTHEKMADSCNSKFKLLKKSEIILSAVSTGSLLFAVAGESHCATVVGAILSTLLLINILYMKEINISNLIQQHTQTASKLWGMREKLLSLLVDLHDEFPGAELRQRRDEINYELEIIYKNAPRTSASAYASAQVAFKNEELYFAPDELDRLLPPQLRTTPLPTTENKKD